MAKLPLIMSWIHLIFGILLFIVFTVTGKYMRVDFPDKEIIPQELRLLMRSRHIYILFSALMHMLLGIYLRLGQSTLRWAVQMTGSGLLFAASILLVWAFVVETYSLRHFSDISRWGIYLSLAGAGLHLIGGLSRNRGS